jgi:hypothetical protein
VLKPQPKATEEQIEAAARLHDLERELVDLLVIGGEDLRYVDPIEEVESVWRVSPNLFKEPERWPPLDRLRQIYQARSKQLNLLRRDGIFRWCEECGDRFALQRNTRPSPRGWFCDGCRELAKKRRQVRRTPSERLKNWASRLAAARAACCPRRPCLKHRNESDRLGLALDEDMRRHERLGRYEDAASLATRETGE